MGVLTDLVMADEHQAGAVAEAEVPIEKFPGVDLKGVGTIQFMTLQSLLTGKPVDDLYNEYEPVSVASDDGPWVHLLPNELTSALSRQNDDQLAQLAARWAATEEFEDWTEDEVRDVLRTFARFAGEAQAKGKRVFAWICL